jgi:hypothetical protein
MNVAKPENRNPQPISRHPLFPAIVALWFAALFGLGSIIVSAALIERIVAATGIAKLVPMAAPPLGTTARILFALSLTGLGGLIGLLAGRRVAQTEDAPARMPFSGADDAEAAAEPAPVSATPNAPRRRRAFSLVAEDASSPAEQEVQQPGAEQPPILNLSDLDLEAVEAAGLVDPALPPASRAFLAPTLNGPDGEDSGALGPEHDAGPLEAEWSPAGDDFQLSPAGDDAQLSPAGDDAQLSPAGDDADRPGTDEDHGPFGRIPEWLDPRQDAHTFSPARWAVAEDEDAAPARSAPTQDRNPEDLSNRLFETYSRTLADERPEPEADGLLREDKAVEATPALAPIRSEEDGTLAALRIAGARLDDLSQIELLERLALAMEQARRQRAEAFLPESTPSFAVPDVAPEAAGPKAAGPEAAGPDDIADATTEASRPLGSLLPRLASVAPFTAPLRSIPDDEGQIAPAATTRIPAALRPVGFDVFDGDSLDDALPGYVPPRHIALAPNAFPAVIDEAEEESDDSGKYAAFNPLSRDFEPDEAEGEEEEAVLANGYSSLLKLSRPSPRQNFVRFDHDATEAFASDAAASQDEGGAALRPFDPPARPDPDETEKALRTALATLQRMSGAA